MVERVAEWKVRWGRGKKGEVGCMASWLATQERERQREGRIGLIGVYVGRLCVRSIYV